jgi:hypothetical protein
MDLLHIRAVSSNLNSYTRRAWLQRTTFDYNAFIRLNHQERLMVRHLRGIPDTLDTWPPNLQTLEYSNTFNKPIAAGMLPHSLTHLTFGTSNQPLTHLNFRTFDPFNQPIVAGMLPPGLTYLALGYYFNRPVDNLPDTLQELVFGFAFNQPVLYWPNSLQKLTFDCESRFNQHVNNLPDTLRMLTFGRHFNQPVLHWPNSLEKLRISVYYNHPLRFGSKSAVCQGKRIDDEDLFWTLGFFSR